MLITGSFLAISSHEKKTQNQCNAFHLINLPPIFNGVNCFFFQVSDDPEKSVKPLLGTSSCQTKAVVQGKKLRVKFNE